MDFLGMRMMSSSKAEASGDSVERSVMQAIESGNAKRLQELLEKHPISRMWDYRALCLASSKGEAEIVRTLLLRGAKVNNADIAAHDTPLHHAVLHDEPEVVRELLARGALVDAQNEYGRTALHDAIQRPRKNDNISKRVQFVRLLLGREASVNVVDMNGMTPLHFAVRAEYVQIVEKLLRRGADINAAVNGAECVRVYRVFDDRFEHYPGGHSPDEAGYTSLHFAVKLGNMGIMFLLLNEGAAVNAKARDDVAPLHIAVRNNAKQFAKQLLNYGADVNATCLELGYTPLHIAVGNFGSELVQLLLDRGAAVDARGKHDVTPLHIAAQKGYKQAVERLLAAGGNVNAATREELYTPLHIACESGSAEVAELLLEHGGAVNARARYDLRPIHIAAHAGYLAIVEQLIEHGADIDCACEREVQTPNDFFPQSELCTPLHFAVESGNTQVVQLLLEKGAAVDTVEEDGVAPIHTAVAKAYSGIVRMLLDAGASVDRRCGSKSYTPLHVAAANRSVQMVQLLLDGGSPVDAEACGGVTSLHIAAEKGHFFTAEKLVDRGADVNLACRSERFVPLHLACDSGSFKIVQLLLKSGANPNAKGSDGTTPLHITARRGYVRVADELLLNGASVDALGCDGNSALHFAAAGCNDSTVRLLLDRGASPDGRGTDGKTPLHVAVAVNSTDIVGILLKNGADVDAADSSGRTALHLACEEDRDEIVRALLDRGTDLDAACANGLTPIDCYLSACASPRAPTRVVVCVLPPRRDNNYHRYHHLDDRYNYQDDDRKSTCVIRKHVVRLTAAGLHVSEKTLASVEARRVDAAYRKQCEAQVAEMKLDKICDAISFHDVLAKDINHLAAFIRNNDMPQMLATHDCDAKYSLYSGMISSRIKKVNKRIQFLLLAEQAKSLLYNFLGLPYDCSHKIFTYLTNQDLNRLIEALTTTPTSD